MKPRRPVNPEIARVRLESLCARSERCTCELRARLKRWQIAPADADAIIAELKANRYVDDDRFARVYVRDRVVNSGYGRHRLRAELALKRIDPDIIRRAIDAIDPDEYGRTLERVIRARVRRTPDIDSWDSRNRVYRQVISRGWESDLVIAMLKRVLSQLKSDDDASDY